MSEPQKHPPIEPREPKAYPTYPRRPEGARRPIYESTQEAAKDT